MNAFSEAQYSSPVCPNCGQNQHKRRASHASEAYILDCFNECAQRGMAPIVTTYDNPNAK